MAGIAIRENIGIFGRMNVGKSTIMNLITSQPVSLVDGKAGTTADVNTTVMELHEFGPVKLFDTAGMDENSGLGKKKKSKTIGALKECDLVLLVVDPSRKGNDLSVEKETISLAKEYGKQLFVIFNLFMERIGPDHEKRIEECRRALGTDAKALAIDASLKSSAAILIDFIKTNYRKRPKPPELLPFLMERKIVALNIPMDIETPEGRLLKPQSTVTDYLLRRFIPFAGFRMDLTRARSESEDVREACRREYLDFLRELDGELGLQLVITDSQAIDIVARWTPAHIPLTTFSITMINYQSGGNLRRFVEGIKAVDGLKDSDSVLIAEACNHDRMCEDIGTVQIPRKLKARLGENTPNIDFLFGRPFPPEEELRKYKLVIHCGGCLVDQQKIQARTADLMRLSIPITNYGLLLSYLDSKETLNRVLKPWGLNV